MNRPKYSHKEVERMIDEEITRLEKSPHRVATPIKASPPPTLWQRIANALGKQIKRQTVT